MTITVWIAEGCLPCNACEVVAPTVFEVDEEAIVLGTSRTDGTSNPNRDERSPLTQAIWEEFQDAIEEAAEGCPVEVIRIDE